MPPKSKANPTKEILSFLLERNRPYSATNLVDEMHGEYSKTVIQKTVDSLVEDGKITCQLIGKTTKLYFAKQEGKQVATKEELIAMDEKNEALAEKIEELKAKRDALAARRDQLSATRKIDELREYRKEIEQKVADETERKDQLITASEGITPEDSINITKNFNVNCEAWRKRKALFFEVLDSIGESADKKRSEFIEELELETDESTGVKLEYKDKKYTVIN